MAEWTTNPVETGAYWQQIEGSKPDIVWIHDGRIYAVVNTTFEALKNVPDCVERGSMFFGPLDLPPPMPSSSTRKNHPELTDAA